MNATFQLLHAGQSIWYDNIQRSLLQNGALAGMIARGVIRGVTSNPSIFMNAVTKSSDYDASLAPLARAGLTPEQIFFALAVEDIQAAADLFLPLYRESQRGDGYVSLEVSPTLAHSVVSGRSRSMPWSSCEMLEHDPEFWTSMDQMGRVLRPGGRMILTTRGIGFPLHEYPDDLWRFTPSAGRILGSIAGLVNVEVTEDLQAPGIFLSGRRMS